MDFDTSWCPYCDKQILPKRYKVPVYPQQQPLPDPPTSPSKDSTDAPTIRRKATGGAIRPRGGLLHGTGRVKANGQLKRSDLSVKQPPAPAPPKPTAPVKLRTVIDQGPTPLYCSDECKLADLANSCMISSDFDPRRQRLSTTPRNTNAGSESDSACSSIESQSSSSSSAEPAKMSPSMAVLAKLYNFPPMPPPAPVFEAPPPASDSEALDYDSGVMMANRRIQAALCPKPAKRDPNPFAPPEPRKPIPGWTDGSNAWRASVYNFGPLGNDGDLSSASGYTSFVATPHRSRRLSDDSPRTSVPPPPTAMSRSRETLDLYSQYTEALTRREESRVSRSAPRRQRPLVPPGAEGQLAVPNVIFPRRVASSNSASTVGVPSSRRRQRGPVNRSESYGDASEEDGGAPSAPRTETHSWSYDGVRTYKAMPPTTVMEKRTGKKIVDGKEVEYEYEVEVIPPQKRLFLFCGS